MPRRSLLPGIVAGVCSLLAPPPAGAGPSYPTPQERDAFRKGETVLVPAPRENRDETDNQAGVVSLTFNVEPSPMRLAWRAARPHNVGHGAGACLGARRSVWSVGHPGTLRGSVPSNGKEQIP